MNPIETLLVSLQEVMAQVPFFVQPLIVALAAMIPFVEGEVASVLGVWAGLHPIVAFLAAVAGNFASVLIVVLFGAKARAAIVAWRARRAEAKAAAGPSDPATDEPPVEAKPESKGRQRFRRFLVRFGVPGASILGPLALPTQVTSAMLVSTGVSKQWVLLWQGVAIVLWTALTTLVAAGILAAVVH